MINLVQNRAPKREPLQIRCLAICVGYRENLVALRQAAIDQIRADEELLRQLGHLVMAVLEDEDQLVELRALDVEFLAGDFVTDVARLAVVGNLESLEGNFFGVHLVVTARFRQARILRPVLGEQLFEVADHVLGQVLQILPRLRQVILHLLHFLAMLVDVEKRDAADAHGQEALDIRVRKLANQLLAERLETLVHGGHNGLIGLALLDLLVDALLDENALQRPEMELILELGLPELEFPL